MSEISIRVAKTEDFVVIDQLERQCAQGNLLKFHFAPDNLETLEPRACKFPNSMILLAEINNRAVGTISGLWRDVNFDGRSVRVGWAFALRVNPAHQRLGIASKLICELENRLSDDHGVKFMYDSLAIDNFRSWKLFEKHKYSFLWTANFFGITVPHAAKVMAPPTVKVEKLQDEDAKKFLQKHFGTAFLFPKDLNIVGKSTIYQAKIGRDYIAANVWENGDRVGIVAIPFYLKLVYYLFSFLSFLAPKIFEKPLSFSKPWQFRWTYPFVAECSDQTNAPRLFDAVIAAAVKDLADSNRADVLMIPCEKGISGLDEKFYDLIQKHPNISPLMRGSSGLIVISKVLNSNDQTLLSVAKKQPFWFLNNST